MKKLLLSIGVLLSLYQLSAQEITSPLDDALQQVDQTSVTSGIIYERVTQFANLYNFNKQENFNTATFAYFQQALSEMHRASNMQLFISRSKLISQVDKEVINVVPLGILNTDFQLMNYREEEVQNGGLTYDEETQQFTQINGQPPFYTLHATVIAPLDKAVKGTGVTFKIDPAYFFQNQKQRIKTLTADFGDGEMRTIISNFQLHTQQFTVNYATDGDKVSTYHVVYEDNSTLTTYSSLYFKYEPGIILKTLSPNCAGAAYKENGRIVATETFTGYAANDPTIYPEIDYRIFYSSNDDSNQLDNPIIILDGFDPGDKRKIEDCDCEQDADCAAANKENGQFNPDLHNSMYDFQFYKDENMDNQNALEDLRSQGFDVIMVNHPTYDTVDQNTRQTVTIDGGAYYIESNALALVELIKRTDSIATSINPNATLKIVGPSMGGQISRYALAYMEKKEEETGNSNEWDHNVSHWVSVDSPHLGANIPMGDQALIYLLTDMLSGSSDDAAQDFYNNQLSSPAAKQQLIEFHRRAPGQSHHHVDQNRLDARTFFQGFNSDRGNMEFINHYNNQAINGVTGSNGFPTKPLNLAIINGSLTGSRKTTFPKEEGGFYSFADDQEKVFGVRSFARVEIDLPWPLGSVVFRTHIATLDSHFLSSGSNERIAKFYKIPGQKTVKSPNINSRGNMDNVPGGWFPAQQDLADAVTGQRSLHLDTQFSSGTVASDLFGWIDDYIFGLSATDDTQVRTLNPVHSFIPSYSAIAHLSPDENWNTPLDFNLTCSSNVLTPFDTYYGEELNTRHTSFNQKSVNWLIANLQATTVSDLIKPEYPVDINDLVGPDKICVGETVTFSFDNPCKLLDESWFYTSGGLMVNSHTNGSVTVTGTADGPAEIVLRRANGETLRKPLYVGAPLPGGNIQELGEGFAALGIYPSNTYCDEVAFRLTNIPHFEQVDDIEWELVSGSSQWDGPMRNGSRIPEVVFYPECNETVTFRVRYGNECGFSDWTEFTVDLDVCDNDCNNSPQAGSIISNNFVILPVPANDYLAIDMVPNPTWTFYTLDCSDGLTFDSLNRRVFDIGNTTNCPTFVSVQLYNFTTGNPGMPVLNIPSHPLGSAINVSGLPSGNYIMHVSHGGQLEVHHIPIQ